MGAILAKFRKEKTTYQILEKLEEEIKDIEAYSVSTEEQKKRFVGNFLLISIGLYVIGFITFYFLFFPPTWTQRIIYSTPLLLFPFIIFFLKRLLAWYYQRKLNKNSKKLSKLRDEKKKIIEKVMDTETYKVAVEILSRFNDGQKLHAGKISLNNHQFTIKHHSTNNKTNINNNNNILNHSYPHHHHQQQQQQQPNTMKNSELGPMTPQRMLPTPNSQLIHRPQAIKQQLQHQNSLTAPSTFNGNKTLMQQSQPQQHRSPFQLSASTPVTHHQQQQQQQQQQQNMNRSATTFGGGNNLNTTPALNRSQQQQYRQHHQQQVQQLQQYAIQQQQPRTPFPIINHSQKSLMEKMVDFLVGDGLNSRYGMICKECYEHNGMASYEEYEYSAFRCAFCKALNPARKLRPICPKLTDGADFNTQQAGSRSDSDNGTALLVTSTSPNEIGSSTSTSDKDSGSDSDSLHDHGNDDKKSTENLLIEEIKEAITEIEEKIDEQTESSSKKPDEEKKND